MSKESREAFEARFAHLDLSTEDASGWYADWTTQFRWRGWSARDAEIAELKAKCESMERITYDALSGALIAGISAERDELKAEIEPLRQWYADSHRIIEEWDTKCSALKARVEELEKLLMLSAMPKGEQR